MKGNYLFPAIFGFICVCIILTHGQWISVIAGVYFFFRLIVLKNQRIIMSSLLTAFFISITVFIASSTNYTQLKENEQKFVIQLENGEYKVDGKQLQFYGNIIKTEKKSSLKEKVVVFYRFHSEQEKNEWLKGNSQSKLLVLGELVHPSGQRNPGEFDYAKFLYSKRIHWIIQAEKIEKKPAGKKARTNFAQIKIDVTNHIETTLPKRIGSYIKTLWLGNMEAFDKNTISNFKQLGILHLISISGLHVHFIFTSLSNCLLRIGLTREKTYFVLMGSLIIFGSFVGWGTGPFRAITSMVITSTTLQYRLPLTSKDSWSLTLIAALLINPYQIYSVGFQLSYLLSLILLLFSATYLSDTASCVLQNLRLSFLMAVSSTPILIFHFFEFAWIGIFANLLFVPFFSGILLPLAAVLLCSYPFSDTLTFQTITSYFDKLLILPEKAAQLLADIPYSTIITGRFSSVGFVILTIALLYWFAALESGHKKKPASLLLFFVFISLLLTRQYTPFGKVIMIDVGQGDAILIKTPWNSGNYLIDTGGKISYQQEGWQTRKKENSIAKKTLIPLLKYYGISSLKQVIISHGDNDHYGELEELSETIKIKQILFGKGTRHKESFDQTVKKIQTKNTKLTEVVAIREKRIIIGPRLSVLWPIEEGTGENEDSLVLYGKIGEKYWLFTGDLDSKGENDIVRYYPNLTVDILKVGHHGSKTSTGELLLERLKPSISLISAGRNNSYGHPHSEVITRLKKYKSILYRTDEQGAIIYSYNNWFGNAKKEEFKTMSP